MEHKRKKYMIEFGLFLIISNIWLGKITDIFNLQSILLIINICIWFAILFILYRNKILVFEGKNLKDRIIDNKILIIYMTLVISIIGMNVYNKLTGNVIEGIFLVSLIPLFLYSIKVNDIFKITLSATETSMLLFTILSVIFAPAMNYQYRGILINPNSTAIFMVFVFCITAYGYVIKAKRKMLHLICCGLAIGYVFFIESRAAEITIIAIIGLWLVHFIIKGEFTRKIKSISLIVIIGVIMSMCVAYIQNDISIYMYKNVFDEQISIYQLHSDNDRIHIGNDKRKINNDVNIEDDVNLIESLEDNRLLNGGDDFTTGRTNLWKAHIEEIGILGHSQGIELNNQVRTAHNTYIHIAYIDGLFSGILLLVFNIGIGIISLKQYIKNKNDRNAMALIAIIVYGMYSMVETVYFPLATHMALLFYLSIINVCQNKISFNELETDK